MKKLTLHVEPEEKVKSAGVLDCLTISASLFHNGAHVFKQKTRSSIGGEGEFVKFSAGFRAKRARAAVG